jgi:hypothetical protein
MVFTKPFCPSKAYARCRRQGALCFLKLENLTIFLLLQIQRVLYSTGFVKEPKLFKKVAALQLEEIQSSLLPRVPPRCGGFVLTIRYICLLKLSVKFKHQQRLHSPNNCPLNTRLN